jgi:hypothetical protein
MMEVESQAVLNTLTELDFQDEFKKNGRNTGNGAYALKGATSRIMMASRPKVSFDHMAAPAPEIMNGSYINTTSIGSVNSVFGLQDG